jgi:hypothetical protein
VGGPIKGWARSNEVGVLEETRETLKVTRRMKSDWVLGFKGDERYAADIADRAGVVRIDDYNVADVVVGELVAGEY